MSVHFLEVLNNMKRRSGTTTIVLVVSLLVGLAFVGAAVNPPPKAPEKPMEKGAIEPEGVDKGKAMQYQAEMIKKSKEDYKQKTKGEEARRKQQALEPAPKDHPTQMEITGDYYKREQDGTQGTAKLDVRVGKAQEQLDKMRAKHIPTQTNVNPGKPDKHTSEN